MKTGKQIPIIINAGRDIVYFLNTFKKVLKNIK